MENQPLISIITVTRNRGELIARCINSVLSQTYQNIEHIVVDGASEDNTDQIVSQFKDKRFRYIKLESNWPLVKTINYGVEMAKGEYISFLDSDDEYLPDKIEKQYNLMKSLPSDYGMVYCWMSFINSETKKTERIHNPQVRGFVADDVVATPVVSGTPTFFFRKKAFLENGGWRDDIGMISDWEMAARFCQKWKVDYVPESLINVYINHSSVRMSTTNYYKDYYLKKIKFHKHFLTAFKSTFDKNPEKMSYHLSSLVVSCIKTNNWKLFLKYYGSLLKLNIPLKSKLSPFYSIWIKPN